jgi:hypothetical protein
MVMAWRRRIRRCGMRPRRLEKRRGRRSARREQKRRNGRVGRRRGRRLGLGLVERSRERERSEGVCVFLSVFLSLCPSDLFVVSILCRSTVTGGEYRRYLTTHSYPLAILLPLFIQYAGIVFARARTRTAGYRHALQFDVLPLNTALSESVATRPDLCFLFKII